MIDKTALATIFQKHDCNDYKWINPRKDIVVAQWVRFHCMFGCDTYGVSACCPPAVPSVAECREMIGEYNEGAALHFPISGDNDEKECTDVWKRLTKLEREVFLAGYQKTFVLMVNSCTICKECSAEGTRQKCRLKKATRPTVEAMGIDVFQTVRNIGYPIQVIRDRGESINRYAFLLIE